MPLTPTSPPTLPTSPSAPSAPRAFEAVAIAVLALGFFLAVHGLVPANPARFEWMLDGDAAQHLLGWLNFRAEPWAWPPGRIAGYGYPAGTTVVFTDSIPLLALLFKPLSPWLPAGWHYFGLWLWACYALNGWFGLRLVSRLTSDPLVRLLAAAFFIAAPPVMLRSGGHESLMAHWIVLAGIEGCLRPWRLRRWLVLCMVAAGVHPYLLVMALGLMIASLVTSLVTSPAASSAAPGARITVARTAADLGIIFGGTLLVMYLAGYFSGSGHVAAPGFGHFSMNLNAFIDPWFNWSRFMRQGGVGTPGQYEGFMFLGAGMVALCVAGVALWATQPVAPSRLLWPLLVVTGAFTLLALSNVVMWGDFQVAHVPLPDWLEQAGSVFRASGRFGWPLFYLVMLFALWSVIRHLPARMAAAALAVGLCVQVIDQEGKFEEFRETFSRRQAWTSPLRSPAWAEMAARSRVLVLISDERMDRIYVPYAVLAAQHRLATNAAHIARADAASDPLEDRFVHDLAQGRVDPAALVVITDARLLARVAPALRKRFVFLDGVWVLAGGAPAETSP